MDKIAAIEKEVESLSPDELATFRQWFLEFDALVWDREIERDVRAGKLDALIDEAIDAKKSRDSTSAARAVTGPSSSTA